MSRVLGSPSRAEGDRSNLERQSTSTRLGPVALCVPPREQRATPWIAVCVCRAVSTAMQLAGLLFTPELLRGQIDVYRYKREATPETRWDTHSHTVHGLSRHV